MEGIGGIGLVGGDGGWGWWEEGMIVTMVVLDKRERHKLDNRVRTTQKYKTERL